MQKKTWLGSVLVIVAGMLWGATGLFVNYFNGKITSLQITFFRVLITAILLSLFLLVYNRSLFKIKLCDIWIFLGSGLVSIASFSYFYFYTIELTSMSFAAVLLYTAPSIVIFLSAVIFREKLTRKKLVAAIIAFIGCVCVTGAFSGSLTYSVTGVITGLVSGLFYALYSIFSRLSINCGYHPFTMTLYTFFFATIGVTVLVARDFSSFVPKVTDSVPTVLMLLLFSCVSALFPYILYTMGMRYVDSGKASVMASVEPVMATILGFFVLKQNPGISGVFGILLVIASIVILNVNMKGKKV